MPGHYDNPPAVTLNWQRSTLNKLATLNASTDSCVLMLKDES
jgi:hypothetical protein